MISEIQNWLLVERLENWEADQRGGFRQFGIPERKIRRAESIKKGDRLFFYVSSRISVMADIREAVEDGVYPLLSDGKYRHSYSHAVRTKPVLVLERRCWVPILDVLEQLSFIEPGKDWRFRMQDSVRRITDQDAAILQEAMKAAARAC